MITQTMLLAPPVDVEDVDMADRAVAYVQDMLAARGMDAAVAVSDREIHAAAQQIIQIERRLFTKPRPFSAFCVECGRALYQASIRAYHEPTQQWYCTDHYPMAGR